MSEYLSKEEIKQWRSSLEKITLEEFAARLGKKIAEDKPTNDLADIVLHGQPVVSSVDSWVQSKTERITSIAKRAFEREQEISPSPFSISKLKLSIDEPVINSEKSLSSKKVIADKVVEGKKDNSNKKSELKSEHKAEKPASKSKVKTPKAKKAYKEVIEPVYTGDELRDDVRIIFKKSLTDREQKVFDHFAEHRNEVVYARDLAVLLELPRDYVYKYIKNLRAKIEGDKLENADKGGFILHV